MTNVRRKTRIYRSRYEITVRENNIKGGINQDEWNERKLIRDDPPVFRVNGLTIWDVSPEEFWEAVETEEDEG